MKVAIFNTKNYDREFLTRANQNHGHELIFMEAHLNEETCRLGFGYEVICAFVNDQLNRQVLTDLYQHGTRLVALRSAGFNNVDLKAANELGISVVRVPAYSPHGMAEHAVALMLALNRHIPRAYNRVREGNFSLEGLMGFEFYGQTMGVVGTGKIGKNLGRIMLGFGMNVLAFDSVHDKECEAWGVKYVSLAELFKQSDVISLHVPLTSETKHMINEASLKQMKQGVMLINTSRGGVVDTIALISGLKSGKIGFLGLDVYEEEDNLFFEDLSGHIIQDDVFERLLTFPNVIITGHQAFFTRHALEGIAETTLDNISRYKKDTILPENKVTKY